MDAARKGLKEAAAAARQESTRTYQRLSEEEWDAVAEDLKEHLRVTETFATPLTSQAQRSDLSNPEMCGTAGRRPRPPSTYQHTHEATVS
jgi:hypothetical protein